MIPKTLLCKTSIRGIAMITNNGKSTIKPNRNLWRKLEKALLSQIEIYGENNGIRKMRLTNTL